MKFKSFLAKLICGALIITGCGFYSPKAMAQESETISEENIVSEDTGETEDTTESPETIDAENSKNVDNTENSEDTEAPENEDITEESELNDEEEAEEVAVLVEGSSTLQPTAINNLCIRLIKTSYLVVTDTGYMRVVYNGEKIAVEYYDSSFNLLNKKWIDLELPVWGGFYAADDAYYIAEGQFNNEENDDAEFIRIIKYDKDWKRIGAAKIKSGTSYYDLVRTPFKAGNVEMVESDGSLYLVTGHEGYVDSTYGMGHQGYLMIKVDTSTMTGSCIDSDLWHSLAQHIKNDGSKLYVLEQSEGSRYTKLSSYDTANNLSKNSFSVLDYGGNRTSGWAIACYSSVDDLEVSESSVLGLGTSIDQSLYNDVADNRDTIPHNIYLTVTPKNNFNKDATTVKWITNYSGEQRTFIGVNITKINDNKFMLAWEENDSSSAASTDDTLSGYLLHYVFVDGEGNVISNEFTAQAPISDCHPILNGSKIVYCASSTNMVDFYTIDTATGAFSKKIYRVAGENATWDINDGILTISGEGTIEDDTTAYYRYPLSTTANSMSYSGNDNDWKPVRNYVTKIIINGGITSIPDKRFSGFNSLKEVELADGVESIGTEAFSHSYYLDKITIPRSVSKIGEDALWCGTVSTYTGANMVHATIYAYRDSYAAQYAQERNILFKGIGDVTSVSLDKTKLTLNIDDTYTFTTTVLPEDAINKSLEWTSSDTSIATVDANGKVTAKAKGTATITAKATDGTEKSATCTVTVKKPVSSVTLDNTSITVNAGSSKKLTATVLPEDTDNTGVTWTSSDTSIATVNIYGTVIGRSTGTVTITATAKDGSGKSASCEVTVVQPVKYMFLNEAQIALDIDETFELIPTISPDNATDKTLTWTSSDPGIATVDDNGKVTAKAQGSVTITVITNDGTNLTDTCEVRVLKPVSSITLDKTNVTLNANENIKLSATVKPDDADDKSIKWTSSDTSIAYVYQTGEVHAYKAGTVTITATANGGIHKSASCTLTIKQPVTMIKLSNRYLSLNLNESKELTATVYPSDASDKSLTWTSSDPSVATVDNNGKVTAKAEGETTITVRPNDGSPAYESCVVNVYKYQDYYDDWYTTYYGTISTSGIYCASNYPTIQAGINIQKSNEDDDVEYRWVACNNNDPNNWFEISPWTKNNNWMSWTPEKSGGYVFVCYARVVGNEDETQIQASFGTEYHKYIKGICQMPYTGEGGGYLIGIESYDNPNQSYKYEMLILDCNLYVQGLDAWVYDTGKCGAQGNCLWTIWQPQYGYYWTLFRIYDADDNLIDEACYGFENIF